MALRALWDVANQFNNKNGSILTSGKIYIYFRERTALATTYHDEDGTVVNSNPVLLDNNGRATVFVNPIYSYTIVVCDYYGQELFSQDITLHDAVSVAKDVLVLGTDGTLLVDTENLPNGVKYDLSVNTDIIATKKSVDDVKTDLNNLTVVVNNHTTEIGQIKEDVEGIESSLTNKKDKQPSKEFTGSATKTIKSIAQNANGELTVEFADIDLPPEVPNVEITSEDNSVQITETTDVQTNTKTFDLSVNVDDPLEYGQFRATNVTGQAQLTKIKGNLNLSNYTIQLKKGNSYHFTVRGSYVANSAANTYNALTYIEYSSFTPIQVNVDNTITDAQFFEISYDVYKLSSDKNYNVAFSSIDGGEVSELFVEVHNLNGVSVNGQGGGTTYSAGDAIDLTNDTISVKYGKGLEVTTDNKLQLKVGKGLTLDNDTSEVTIDNDTLEVTIDNAVGEEAKARIHEDELIRNSIPTKTSQITNDSGFFNTDDIYNGRIVIHLTPLQKYSNYIDVNNLSTRFSGIIDSKLRIALFGTSINVINDFTPSYSASDGVGEQDWPALAYFEIPNFVAKENISVITSIINSNRPVIVVCYAGSNKFGICVNRNNRMNTSWYDIATVPIMF